ncbi:protein kinase [Corallococcus sp. H22C18031201]|nr:protein kinase [Corallococcus sp. H22C18031201]
MPAIEFALPRGAILFSAEGFSYEFREDLGEAHHGQSLFLARRRTPEGHPRGKVLLKAIPEQSEDAGNRVLRARAKLLEEVRVAQRLDHPGIQKVFGLHKVDGYWYAILEHPAGASINELLTLASECGQWFSPSFALYVGMQVAEALAHAHSATDSDGTPLNLIHRAVNVDNIYVDWDGSVQLVDFGLSKSRIPGRIESSVRRPHGDCFYAAPEALLGGKVDARSDLFNLGAVMLELMSGKCLLYPEDPVSPEKIAALTVSRRRRVARAIRRATLAGFPPLVEDAIWRAVTYTETDVEAATRGLPQSARVLLGRLLSPQAAWRYSTAAELATVIKNWLGGTFGKADAAEELKGFAEQASRTIEELGIPVPSTLKRGRDATTTLHAVRRSPDGDGTKGGGAC